MADPAGGAASPEPPEEPSAAAPAGGCATRNEKRKALKKLKRKQLRREVAIRERDEEEARLGDPEEQLKIRLREQEEAEIGERERKLFEERERLWLEAVAARKAAKDEEERRKKLLEEENHHDVHANERDEDDEWDYIEEGPAEIIWQGNEIIVKKKRVRVAKRIANRKQSEEDDNRPTSNPLPPQSVAFASYMDSSSVSAQEVLERVAQEVPNFGTEQDKAHCPFHLKTGACRFGSRCSRVHFHPDKSCTLLIKNMYNGPGLAWEQDEGLEYTDEEVEHCYEEFYEDVHTEFLKFGELVNFKVCKNGSYHLRGNVYVHYKSLDSAVLAYNNINARYFAGKQITCEFISVTRWKVAICGEYMKSKLKTCSHGSACNFIHCFRNPGGDYEWADWDNPPPKYWIRKMVALFGPSNEYEYDKQVDYKESESPWSSNRKRKPTNKRYHSRRFDSSSPAKDSELMRDQYSGHSVRREYSRRSREEPASVEKHGRSEEYDKSGKKYRMHGYDSGEDIYKDEDRDLRKKHQKYEENYYDDQEKFKRKHKEDLLNSKRGKAYPSEHMKSERYKSNFHEQQEYVHSSEYTDDDRELSDSLSNSHSSDKSVHRLSIDEERYNGRRSSDDLGSNVDSSCVITIQGRACLTERREYDQHNSWHHSNHKSYDDGVNGHSSKLVKEKDGNHRVSSHDSEWKVGSEGSDLENAHDHLPRSSSSRRKHDRSSRKRKLHQDKGKNKDVSDEFSNKEFNRREERYSSRCSGSSRRKIDR